ncbi:helix-turn-helix transcriptional regulator [Clostridium sp. JNZ J1-5]
MSFAENLKQIRNEKELTQERLAELLDVTRQAVYKWEQGVGYPKTEKLIILAKVLNTSLDWLFETELTNKEKIDAQSPILPGVVSGLEVFSSAVNALMEKSMSKINDKD